MRDLDSGPGAGTTMRASALLFVLATTVVLVGWSPSLLPAEEPGAVDPHHAYCRGVAEGMGAILVSFGIATEAMVGQEEVDRMEEDCLANLEGPGYAWPWRGPIDEDPELPSG